MTKNVRYFARVLLARATLSDRSCPYCGESRPSRVGRKYWMLTLYECPTCGLKYRYPKDEPTAASRFYDRRYQEPTAADVPEGRELMEMMRRGFADTPFDQSEKVQFLSERLPQDAAVLDFGASFGYTLFQLQRAGSYKLVGYELATSRANIARTQLGVDVTDTLQAVESSGNYPFDCVFSSHVLEHLPHLRDTFPLFGRLIKPGGLLVIWTPNATAIGTPGHPATWAHLVGEPHTMAIDYPFIERALSDNGFTVVYRGPDQADELCIVAAAASRNQPGEAAAALKRVSASGGASGNSPA